MSDYHSARSKAHLAVVEKLLGVPIKMTDEFNVRTHRSHELDADAIVVEMNGRPLVSFMASRITTETWAVSDLRPASSPKPMHPDHPFWKYEFNPAAP